MLCILSSRDDGNGIWKNTAMYQSYSDIFYFLFQDIIAEPVQEQCNVYMKDYKPCSSETHPDDRLFLFLFVFCCCLLRALINF